jgi:hypothetical protein
MIGFRSIFDNVPTAAHRPVSCIARTRIGSLFWLSAGPLYITSKRFSRLGLRCDGLFD